MGVGVNQIPVTLAVGSALGQDATRRPEISPAADQPLAPDGLCHKSDDQTLE